MSNLKTVAVVGATGAVGQAMLSILAERDFPIKELYAFASERSVGKKVSFKDHEIPIRAIEPGCFKDVDIALFSAGGSISEAVVPQAVVEGAICIDNTAAFRYQPEIPLVVPEVNKADIAKHNGIISNPNCSTIQLLVAIKPLHDAARLRRLIVSTYQSVSGAGQSAINEMIANTKAALAGELFEPKKFPHPIAFNALPHIDRWLEGDWTKEEMKMVWETHKILGVDDIGVTATCVRIPVYGGHSESVYAEFDRKITVAEAHKLWNEAPGVEVVDDPRNNKYPLAPDAYGTDPVYVGRTREDRYTETALNFWCVADNLRKGAALNTVQIAECLLEEA